MNTSLADSQKLNDDERRIVSDMFGADIDTSVRVGGGANSRVFKCGVQDKAYIVKFYFCDQSLQRNRLNTEFNAFDQLHKADITLVPEVIARNDDQRCGIYEYIEGMSARDTEITDKDIAAVVDLLKVIDERKAILKQFKFGAASEACFSLDHIFENLDWRLQRFSENDVELKANCLYTFLNEEYVPMLKVLKRWCSDKYAAMRVDTNDTLLMQQRVLSPSDFGFHNAIKQKNGRLKFFDFEYFGWDDPVKMISDFVLHPAMTLSDDHKRLYVKQMLGAFEDYPLLRKRLKVLFPCFAMKWTLIFLNEFIRNDYERRGFAGNAKEERGKILDQQLNKAKTMCAFVQDNYKDFIYDKSFADN